MVASGMSDSGWGWGKIGALLISLFCGGLLCVACCIIALVRQERFRFLSLIPAIPCALILLVGGANILEGELLNRKVQQEYDETDRLKLKIREDPSIILRERWDLKNAPTTRNAIEGSLDDAETHYPDDLIHRMYQELPSLRNSLLRHPAFDAAFLAKELPEAEAKAEADHPNNDPWMLMNIIENPNCPLPSVEQVARIRDKQDAYKRCTYAFNILADKADSVLRKRARLAKPQLQKNPDQNP